MKYSLFYDHYSTCLIFSPLCLHLTHFVSTHYSLCLNAILTLSPCNVYSLCHAFLAVPAVPLGLPLQVEHAWPRCVAVALRRLGVDHDHHDGDGCEVNGDQDDRFKEDGDADKCGESMVSSMVVIVKILCFARSDLLSCPSSSMLGTIPACKAHTPP